MPEIRLNDCNPLIFDGAHKVDICLLDTSQKLCYPIEAKLGLDRLSRNEFKKRFLAPCGISHNNTRISGSIISVLERNLPGICKGHDLSVTYNNEHFRLTAIWGLIIRSKVAVRWSKNATPDLSQDCKIMNFEQLVLNNCSREKFNDLVYKVVNGDYYSSWIENK